ncbi:MAG: glycoside hydrolase family 127 protein, partial [Bacteroidales bacterium]|nr:glycoside hydrolase family 127 protein [Bacteroidales bacterium]
ALSFWERVVQNHSYITGGNSEWEHFGEPGILDAERTNCNCETCNSYNMSKLSKELFKLTGDVKFADFYENTFINEQLQPNYPHQFIIALLQPDIRLPSIVFFGEDFSLIFALRGYQSAQQLERFLEFFSKDLHKTGEDWTKFNENFKSKL